MFYISEIAVKHLRSFRRKHMRNTRPLCFSRYLLVAILLIVMVGSAPTLRADFIISIDFDSVADGIQNSISVDPGQSFTARIVLEFEDPLGLDSYRFSVAYNDAAMTVASVNQTLPLGFSVGLAGPPAVGSSVITPFNGESDAIGSGPVAIAPIVVGTINFTAGATSGVFAITPYEDDLFDFSFHNDMATQITPTFNGGFVTITAVPEPSSILLVATAGGVLFQYRFRRRKLLKRTN